jgi:addiction module HigA family antidote
MSIKNTGKRKVRPTHPGEMLREDFMPDYDLNIAGMAQALGISRQTVNELLREHRSLTPLMALRLSRLFGNAQRAYDLWEAQQSHQGEIKRIRPLKAA